VSVKEEHKRVVSKGAETAQQTNRASHVRKTSRNRN
jgi:hypothetical protein